MNYIVAFVILITVVVFIHEYGHYYFAKKYGVETKVFSIGLGKEIFGWNDKSGTRWRVSWIPIGGYVKFFGDDNIFSAFDKKKLQKKYSPEDQKKLLAFKTLSQRSIILLGGPLANFLLAIVIYFLIFTFVGKDFTPASIDDVQKGSPAYVAGLKKNDIILSIDGNEIKSILNVPKFITLSNSEYIDVLVSRSDQEVNLKVKPNIVEAEDQFGNKFKKREIGIKIIPFNNEINHVRLGPAKALYYSIYEVYSVSTSILKVTWGLLRGLGDSSQLGGPIRIAKFSGQVIELGIVPFFSIIAYISTSLGLVNLFPIPLLDGGHLFFNLIEKIRGRPLSRKSLEFAFRIGVLTIGFLIIFTTFNDLKDVGLLEFLRPLSH
jgi:regulator of sigma E protease|tara:strand:- start:155 stop:1285 length:1131 start_codon:yes stop_codon:yes gene_type:complete